MPQTSKTKTMEENEKMLTTKEAAKFLGLSLSGLYKLIANGTIPCYKPLKRKIYFDKEELEKWMHANKKGGAK